MRKESEPWSVIFFCLVAVLFCVMTAAAALAHGLQVNAEFDTRDQNLARLELKTKQASICKYDTQTKEYSEMGTTFEVTGGISHSQVLVITKPTTLYVACGDYTNRVYTWAQLELEPARPEVIGANPLTARVTTPPSRTYANVYYLIAVLALVGVTAYSLGARGHRQRRAEEPRTSLPKYSPTSNKIIGLPTIPNQRVHDMLQRAHNEIDRQRFEDSMSKYKYLLTLLDTHRLESEGNEEEDDLAQQIHLLYHKLTLYNHMLLAKKYWQGRNRVNLRQVLNTIYKSYNNLRGTGQTPLLANAEKAYKFYGGYLSRTPLSSAR